MHYTQGNVKLMMMTLTKMIATIGTINAAIAPLSDLIQQLIYFIIYHIKRVQIITH